MAGSRANTRAWLVVAVVAVVAVAVVAAGLACAVAAGRRGEGFTGAAPSATACPPGMTLFADQAGALQCCAGAVDAYARKCAAGARVCALAGVGAGSCAAMDAAARAAEARRVCPAAKPHLARDANGGATCCSRPPVAVPSGGTACPPGAGACSALTGAAGADACSFQRLAERRPCAADATLQPQLGGAEAPIPACVSLGASPCFVPGEAYRAWAARPDVPSEAKARVAAHLCKG